MTNHETQTEPDFTARPSCLDPIECGHEAALGQAREQVRRLGLMVDEYGAGASALTDKLKRVRDLHRETCILAQADVPSDVFVCGMCVVLDAPAVSVPPPAPRADDQADLRDRIAEVLAAADGWRWAEGFKEQSPTWQRYQQTADAVLAVLPAPADRADRVAVLAEVADWLKAWRPEFFERWAITEQERYEGGVDDAAAELRRLADESGPCVAGEQQNETPEAEAHPAEHSWAAELHDPLADEWVPGTRYAVRDRAVNALAHSRRLGPTWKDGSPTERRLVRATTTYTVEPEGEPAAGVRQDGAQPE